MSLITGSSSGIRCAILLGENINTTKNNVRMPFLSGTIPGAH
jgi:hypothetical protein